MKSAEKSTGRKIEHQSSVTGILTWILSNHVNARIDEWQRLQSDSWKRLKQFFQDKVVRFLSVLLKVAHIYSYHDLVRYQDIINRNLANMEAEMDELLKNPTADEPQEAVPEPRKRRVKKKELEDFEV